MSKKKNIVIRSAVALAIFLALPVIVYAVAIWIYSKQVEDRIAKIKSSGDPVIIADLASKPTAPDDDAAQILQTVKDDVDAVASEIASLSKDDRLYRGNLSDAEQKMIRAAFESHPELIPTLKRAAHASEYGVTIGKVPSAAAFLAAGQPRVQSLRSVARILAARAMLLNAEGKPDEALDTCVTLLRLCRHFDKESALVAHLVVIACRSMAVEGANVILRGDGISETAHAKLEAELARHDMPAAHQDALVEERAIGITSFRDILDQVGYSPARIMFLNDMADYLRLTKTQMTTAGTPYHIAIKKPSDTEGLGTLTSLLIPATEQAREATARTIARLNCLRILNAISSRPAGPTDISLDDLNLPPDVTTDPCTGKPLLLKHTDRGWLIYSLGPDLKDNAGSVADNQDIGLAPP